MRDLPSEQFWSDLRLTTQARIGLGRVGDSLPTQRTLEFAAAHAAARDAVHTPLDVQRLVADIQAIGIGMPPIVASRATDRAEYLRHPDLGKVPRDLSHVTAGHYDVGFMLGDGLSPRALIEHGAATLEALVAELSGIYSIAPPVIAVQARVALGDHVATAIGARTMIVLIGERPGLSVADSLGMYLTHLPTSESCDADRNCVSNIHPPEGLGYKQVAKIVAGLLKGARVLGHSGVALKDTSREHQIG